LLVLILLMVLLLVLMRPGRMNGGGCGAGRRSALAGGRVGRVGMESGVVVVVGRGTEVRRVRLVVPHQQ
jgi:hypothetical protein